ncbi:MAG: EamA family transporter [Alphaproteobacteria bacterium]|nr:EamA family transporter [Alphaproteobacteria bacterium]MBU0796204.1 EamA family transporter [Alphaproteobacteria bacterium]MBU0888448.1 EamA family transporter [Alphaproteobacteria bacterium]MBU1813089.1 EamA family transporter [Alphaproteobacteria bacterium]
MSNRATLIGGMAVLMWATLALFTTLTGKIPPFLLVAMAFAVATAMIAVKWAVRGESPRAFLRQPWPVWLLGVGGLFGYHFFYFLALRNAPPVEAGLIAYLWPLLIVLFSSLLPGERLRWWHLAGALAGLAGAALLVTGGGQVAFRAEHALGYLAALACAFTWSGYSVLSRFTKSVPTDAVGGFCAVSAVLGLICHVIFETTVLPASPAEWLAVLALGLGPVGAAFFVWDYGVKHGDIKALGAFSYAAPLLSTILLVLTGQGEASGLLALACVLIVGGAVLAAKDMFTRKA